MHLWAQAIVVLCVVVVTAALLPAIAALRRAAERGERVMALVEHDLPPLVGEVREIIKELSALARDARGDLERMGAVLERAHDVADGLGRIVGAVAGVTRAGQVIGIVAGLKTGLEVVLHRLRKRPASRGRPAVPQAGPPEASGDMSEGEHHEQRAE